MPHRAGQVVHVKVEMRAAHDPVVKLPRREDILLRQRLFARKTAGFPHAHHRPRADDVAPLKSRHEAPQIPHDGGHLRPADQLRAGQVFRTGAVRVRAVRHVAGDDARQGRAVDQQVTGRCGNMLSGQRLQLAFFCPVLRFKRTKQYGAVKIDARHLEHQRAGLHLPV